MQKKLTIPDQIALMKAEGIGFHIIDETEAEAYITENTVYFKIKTFAKNYEKYQRGPKKGQYVNLEFAYLKELAILDGLFRKLALDMCLNIEHSMKVQINRDFSANQRDDGYGIVAEFLKKHNYIFRKLSKMAEKNSPYSSFLYRRFLEEPALWNLTEVLSFGEFVTFFIYYYKKFPPESPAAPLLQPVKYLHNASAHNNAMLNNMKPRKDFIPNRALAERMAAMKIAGKGARKKRLHIPVIHDVTATFLVFDQVVRSRGVRESTFREWWEFMERCRIHSEYFQTNDLLLANYDFLCKVIDSLDGIEYNIGKK